MKTAAVVILLALTFSCNAHAILRPMFPHRTYPPVSGNRSRVLLGQDAARTVAPKSLPARP